MMNPLKQVPHSDLLCRKAPSGSALDESFPYSQLDWFSGRITENPWIMRDAEAFLYSNRRMNSIYVTFITTQTQLQCEEDKENGLENRIKGGDDIFMLLPPPLMLRNWYRWQKTIHVTSAWEI